jgi:hypothetical protein
LTRPQNSLRDLSVLRRMPASKLRNARHILRHTLGLSPGFQVSWALLRPTHNCGLTQFARKTESVGSLVSCVLNGCSGAKVKVVCRIGFFLFQKSGTDHCEWPDGVTLCCINASAAGVATTFIGGYWAFGLDRATSFPETCDSLAGSEALSGKKMSFPLMASAWM